MKLAIGYESNHAGVFELLEEIPYNLSPNNVDLFEISKTITFENGEKLQIYSAYISATKGFASEIFQNGKVIFQLTSFDYFDVVFLTFSGVCIRLYAGNLKIEKT